MKRIAVLYDGRTLARWQKRALELVNSDYEFLYLIPKSVRQPRRHPLRHFLYYLLNLLAIRNSQNRRMHFPLPQDSAGRILRFDPEYEGAWAVLPQEVIEWLARKRVGAVIKFGLSLLRVPKRAPPIVSWHHGDPMYYRGRPAGFYEICEGREHMGQMVQRLGNRLDGGEILAFAETRIHPHSYRRTLEEAFQLSPYLLPQALRALAEDRRIARSTSGRNYRLPSNLQVAKAVASMGGAFVRRMAYGAFVEKGWNVSTVQPPRIDGASSLIHAIEERRENWTRYRPPPGTIFLADPFFNPAGEILAEAVNRHNGRGRIARLRDGTAEVLGCDIQEHMSYPGTFEEGGEWYVIPESVRAGPPAVLRLDRDRLVHVDTLDFPHGNLIDPTLMRHGGQVFLFGNLLHEGRSILRLWVADTLFDGFEEHPDSPVRVSSRGARMAGAPHCISGRLMRFGQDFRRSYGDGIIAFEIEQLDAANYREKQIGAAAFVGVKGPHTINFSQDAMVFDWYVDKLSPLAWARRLAAIF